MTDLTSAQAHALRLKIIDAEGDIAERQKEIASWKAMLGEASASQPPVQTIDPLSVPLPAIQGPFTFQGWSNPWASNAFKKDLYAFSGDNVKLVDGALVFTVAEGKSGQAQTHENQKSKAALFEIDATTDRGISGLIQAPLYLFGDNGHEIDFEVIGTKGLQLAVHTDKKFGAYEKLIPGDFSGRHRYGIAYKAGEEIIWYLDGKEIGRVKAADLPAGQFPTNALKPFAETWPTSNVGWAGPWTHTASTMTMHGYRRTAL